MAALNANTSIIWDGAMIWRSGLLALLISSSAQADDLLFLDASTFGSVTLSQKHGLILPAEETLDLGSAEFVADYGLNSIFAEAGRAVGRLDILTDRGHTPCTAFLVAENRVITNYHCVPGLAEGETAAIFAVKFHAGYLKDGISHGTTTYHVNPVPLEASKALDYAVLQVLGDANAAYGALLLSDVLPRDRDPLWVIGHPLGEAQRITRERCQADAPALADGRLLSLIHISEPTRPY